MFLSKYASPSTAKFGYAWAALLALGTAPPFAWADDNIQLKAPLPSNSALPSNTSTTSNSALPSNASTPSNLDLPSNPSTPPKLPLSTSPSVPGSNPPATPALPSSSASSTNLETFGKQGANARPSKSALAAATSPGKVPYSKLQNSIWKSDKRKPYAQELKNQENPSPIGRAKVERVPKDYDRTNISVTKEDDSIRLAKPPLKALISIDKNLNPYGLDAEYSQEIRLRDALLAASEGNLDILGSVSNVQVQKWRLLNAYTGYLPNINLGFNEIGLNSISALPITAVARAGATGITATAAGAGAGAAGITTIAQTTKTIIQTPLTVLNSGFTWTPIQGGKLWFTALAEKHRLRGYKAQLRGDVSDTLLKCARNYYDLVLNDALLQIRTTAVETDEEQVRQNTTLEDTGLATNLDVLQSKTQLSRDRQGLINQQRLRRAAAVQLAHTLNANLGQDLVPTEHILRKVRLVSKDVPVTGLLKLAIDNRPELKQYEELRQAAKKLIAVSTSSLLPSISLGGNIVGLASNIGKMEPSYILNLGVTWKFNGLGTAALTDAGAARWRARQALIDANKQFIDVFQQVRNSYNECFTAESAIEETTNEVASASEELRLARLRLDTGLGTNLDVLTAQRDLTQARLDKAQTIVNFNTAQVQLVHDIGLSSVDSFTSGRLITSSSN
jgi:outer membrane protein TolC